MKNRLHIPLALCAALLFALSCQGASRQAATDFVYRLPVSAWKNGVQVAPDTGGVYSNNKTIPCVFHVNRGDTVFAARKGVVLFVTDLSADRKANDPDLSIEITVRHADGTFATYAGFESGSGMVRPRQKVYPDTPLGIAGSFDGKNHHFFFSVSYTINKPHSVHPLSPAFATAAGEMQLQADGYYTAALSDQLICREMTKCEKKKYNKRKQPFPAQFEPVEPPLKLRRTIM
jgi:hypothetical protein